MPPVADDLYAPAGLSLGAYLLCLAMIAAASAPAVKDGLISLTVLGFLMLIPVLVPRRGDAGRDQLRLGVLLCAVWAVSQTISEFLAGGHLIAGLLASWEPVVIALSTIAFFAIMSDVRRAIAALYVLFAADLVYYGLWLDYADLRSAWKFGFGVPLTLIVVLLTCRLKRPGPSIALVVLAAVNFALGFRNLGGVCFLAGIVLSLMRVDRRRAGSNVKAIAAAVVGLALVVGAYSWLAGSGRLGLEERDKYLAQSASPAGLLFTGRPELLLSTSLLLHEPVIGIGSKRQITSDDVARFHDLSNKVGLGISAKQEERLVGSGANLHSLLFGAWVAAGVGSLPYWFWLYRTLYRSLRGGSPLWAPALPLVVVWSLLVAWDSIFSPWRPHYELHLGALSALALRMFLSNSRNGTPK